MALKKEKKEQLIREFAINSQDTGSAEVQVALLTEDIRELTEHFKLHPKDFSSKRGMLIKVARRRKFLKYLENNDGAAYQGVIQRLGLKK